MVWRTKYAKSVLVGRSVEVQSNIFHNFLHQVSIHALRKSLSNFDELKSVRNINHQLSIVQNLEILPEIFEMFDCPCKSSKEDTLLLNFTHKNTKSLLITSPNSESTCHLLLWKFSNNLTLFRYNNNYTKRKTCCCINKLIPKLKTHKQSAHLCFL